MSNNEQTIRTLGLYQPFATLMLHGKVETRWVYGTRKAPFPLGKYLIYATQKCYNFFDAEKMAEAAGQGEEFREVLKWESRLLERGTINPNTREFLLGHAICIGDLVSIIDPITAETNKKTFVEYQKPCSSRRVGLVFENITRIEPFPFKGKQGIGFLTEAQKALIKTI